ncbi:hypothetical protein NA57DRAFT_36210 [Rhizodiscina lignyota]|uniref:Sister chromatid cohesion protein n=1 Tax=Rhizodiscina lignyota TaxID=1504668 RepID=A0A9P4IIK9_9PEZI|nr:hypothetical protein NA57DRAFT_36210 [Rhizodiscina lignyota]
MPRTRTRTTAPVAQTTTEEEEEEVQPEQGGLQFKEALTWRAGKPIPVADLLRRLQALSKELQELEQEEVERESLIPPAKELATHNLLDHKDRGVRAWTACCLVDMFRLCAPDAPYTATQLKDIFTLIVKTIIPSLADPSSPYNAQHLFVLKSLTEVRSIVLLTDIPSSQNLIHHLFESCFDVLSGPSKAESGEELTKNVEHHMTTLLGVLLDESQTLPTEVIDIVLAQFLRADPRSVASASSKGKKGQNPVSDKQMTLLLKEAPPAYNMAKNICNAAHEKMTRYISQYFSQVLLQATTGNMTNGAKHGDDSDDEDFGKGPSEADLLESKKAHNMIRELWRSCPSVLQDTVPQLEMELGAEDIQLRLLATETFGDMISGIGAAGPPAAAVLNASAYPSQSLAPPSDRTQVYNFLTTPNSPLSFTARHQQPYQSFISRRKDKSPVVRAAWTTGIGRILMTSAGGVGLDHENEDQLLQYLSEMLVDGDERVRLSAVKAIESFSFDDIIQKLGSKGGAIDAGSVLANLTDRVKDKKSLVRNEAMRLLGKIWGVAAGAIAEGSERVSTLLGPVPSKILETYFINDLELSALADRVLFESLLPLDYPPLKAKAAQLANGASQKAKDSQTNGSQEDQAFTEADIDKIRAERELVLIRDLEEKAKTVFFVKGDTRRNAKFMEAFLLQCEAYNGGVVEKDEKKVKDQLGKLIDAYAKMLPEPSRVSDDLWKFAKMHDRRSYTLIRFCINPESDYRKIQKAIKEFTKRMEGASGSTATMVDTLTILIYRVSVLLFNRSHVPAIIEYSRTDESGLGSIAHDVLKEISTRNPEVFKAHTQELCRALETEAPSNKKTNSAGTVADLRACSGFAKRFPNELPKDRKFAEAMKAYALYGSPPESAKYAVSILLTNEERKELNTKELLAQCLKGFTYGSNHFLARLAAMSQLMLVGTKDEVDETYDTVSEIAISQVLLHTADADETTDESNMDVDWTDTPDENCIAKTWALRLLVNRLWSYGPEEAINEVAMPIYKFLNNLIRSDGQLPGSTPTPEAHRSRLKLLAAQLMLKLCSSKRLDALLTPDAFNHLATVAQSPIEQVRSGFVRKVMKYLGQDKLPRRFYTILFLLAFEPTRSTKDEVVTFIRARTSAFARQKDTAMEALFARFLSLLAHHPDFDKDPEYIKDFAQYILFYLKGVANADNLSLIYHVAQRVKSVRDGIDPLPKDPAEMSPHSEALYILSDLAQTIIRRYEEQHGWNLQSYPAKLKLPAGLFAALPNHEIAQEIAMKQFLPEEVADAMEDVVKASLRAKKVYLYP